MAHGMLTDYLNLYESWSRAVTDVAWGPWRLLDSQYRAGVQVLGTVLGAFAGKGAAPARQAQAAAPETLERRAAERLSKGLPPPREVYDAQNRGRVNWSEFPD